MAPSTRCERQCLALGSCKMSRMRGGSESVVFIFKIVKCGTSIFDEDWLCLL